MQLDRNLHPIIDRMQLDRINLVCSNTHESRLTLFCAFEAWKKLGKKVFCQKCKRPSNCLPFSTGMSILTVQVSSKRQQYRTKPIYAVPSKVNIDLVTVFDTILTSRQTREKLQCLYENLMSNNFRRTAVLKKI